MDDVDDGDDPLHDHKLCGFFLAILTTPSPSPSLSPGTPASPSDLTLVTFTGVPLLPLTPVALDGRRKRRRKEVSRSAVIQVLELARKGNLRVQGEVVGVVGDGNGIGRVRVVVLVDVFLPMATWDKDGWQFPSKADGVLAASLFEHVSCDWKKRNSIRACLVGNKNYIHEKDEDLWYDSDCHVLGCRMHSDVHCSSKKGLFNLHELFQGLPTAVRVETRISTKIKPKGTTTSSGIWNASDDVLTNVLSMLSPRDLVSVAATCHHLRSLALSIVPCVKLKLYPHQRAAIEWMLKRECKPSVFPHPLVMEFSTEDGFNYFINAVSGKITTGMAPTITDFRGGMFCDEPGLGKTITALSLILKTHGTLAKPPHGANVVWCMHHHVQRCGYYEVRYNSLINGNPSPISKRTMSQNIRRGQNSPGICSSEQNKSEIPKSSASNRSFGFHAESFGSTEQLHTNSKSLSRARITWHNRKLNDVKKNLMDTFDKDSALVKNATAQTDSTGMNCTSESVLLGRHKRDERSRMDSKEHRHKFCPDSSGSDETWVQCDACGKWRKLFENSVTDAKAAWFCSMNDDHLHQSCAAPQENWDLKDMIMDLPGFCTKGSSAGKERNISFFLNILKEHFALINSETMKALIFLAELSCDRLLEMERNGLTLPNQTLLDILGHEVGYEKIFQAFGLVRKLGRQEVKWCYPRNLENLEFDALALEIALTKPLDMFRLYLSRATLIVVPANLVEHWKTQINKLAIPGQLRVFVWTDQMKPAVHNLAWDYDIVITTFSRFSAEWNPRNRSVLMHVHWLRIILDEGHTLGSSICLTNKLQMAISLVASSRWILTGTLTPNTPKSQLSNLQPMLKFLCEEVYGQDQESWDSGILKPFQAEIEEGSFRLLKLLERIMISSRKKDLKTIPPCTKKISFLHFNEEHAKSYNELVLTIRRNILLADWNDPSHIESLLNPKQWKFRSNTIRNVRLSCCVAGHIKMAGAGHDIQETMDDLVQQGLDPLSDEHEHIRSSLLRGCKCSRCEEWCRLPVITPCRHLLCLDCVVLDSKRCTFPRCGRPYEMQLPESLARPENPNPKWPVPKDLIELQPSYRQDKWDPDWNSTSSSKVSYLVERLLNLKEANRTMGFCENENNWNASLSSEKCNINSLTVDACERLRDSSSMSKPEKAIIFSQFLEHIHVIEQQLEISGIKYGKLYSPTHFSDKMKSLVSFQQDAGCVALIMDGSAALGLDLSFVTHVFLMEPIWDKSIEEQVISRAHRMGATRPIHVETLAMRGTIEEQMLGFLQDASEGRKILKQDINKTDASEGRVQRTLHDFAESSYLAHIGFVKTNNANR